MPEKKKKKKDFLDTAGEILKKNGFKITPGIGFRKYKGGKFEKVATLKAKLIDLTKSFSISALLTSAQDAGVVAGIKMGKTGFTLDAGAVAKIGELAGLKKVNWGFFVGGHISL